MKLHVVTVPLSPTSTEALDALQSAAEIARYDHYLIDLPTGPAVAIVAAVRGSTSTAPTERRSGRRRRSLEDWLAELDDDARPRFERLRAWRKMTARDEGIPVYALASNAQLAEMARMKAPSKSKLADVAGFGRTKVDRYSEQVLTILSEVLAETAEAAEAEESDDA